MVKKTEKKDYSFQIAASEMDIPTSVSSSSSYSRPSEYSTMCKYSWSDYTADTGYGYLIDRMIHFGVNGTRWHLKNKEFLSVFTARRVILYLILAWTGLKNYGT